MKEGLPKFTLDQAGDWTRDRDLLVGNPKSVPTSHVIIYKQLGIVAVTETWQTEIEFHDNNSIAEILNTLVNYDFYHVPRLNRAGGGTGVFFRKGFSVHKNDTPIFTSTECMDLTISPDSRSSIRLITVYRPTRCVLQWIFTASWVCEFNSRLSANKWWSKLPYGWFWQCQCIGVPWFAGISWIETTRLVPHASLRSYTGSYHWQTGWQRSVCFFSLWRAIGVACAFQTSGVNNRKFVMDFRSSQVRQAHSVYVNSHLVMDLLVTN